MARYREEVINIKLASILREMGFRATGEVISKGKLPDVMVYVTGVRINIEGRFETSSQVGELKERCSERIKDGISDIAVGIIYPEELREAEDDSKLARKIRNSEFESFVVFMSSKGMKKMEFKMERIEEIAGRLNHLYSVIVTNDILKEQIEKVGNAIKETSETAMMSGLFFSSEIVVKKLKEALGIKEK